MLGWLERVLAAHRRLSGERERDRERDRRRLRLVRERERERRLPRLDRNRERRPPPALGERESRTTLDRERRLRWRSRERDRLSWWPRLDGERDSRGPSRVDERKSPRPRVGERERSRFPPPRAGPELLWLPSGRRLASLNPGGARDESPCDGRRPPWIGRACEDAPLDGWERGGC